MQTPPWLNRLEYPFSPHWIDLPAGRMHYVEEGKGETIVMLHGNPDWLGKLWEQRNKIRDIPALLFWGMKDIAFRKKNFSVGKSS